MAVQGGGECGRGEGCGGEGGGGGGVAGAREREAVCGVCGAVWHHRAVCGCHTVAARHVEGTRAVVRVEAPKVRRGWRWGLRWRGGW